MRDYKSSMGGLMLRIKELMIKVLFTFAVGVVSWMQNQIKDMRCHVRGHNTKNPNIFYYKSLENKNVGDFMKNPLT
jgi:hypothetical protein